MATTLQMKQDKAAEKHKLEALATLIGEQVSFTLGAPADLLKVQVRMLWENHYRVNIFTGKDVASARVANSYFVKGDNEGNIVGSSPKVTKQY